MHVARTAVLFWIASLELFAPAASTTVALGQDADPVRRVRRPVRGTYVVVLRGKDDPLAVGSETASLFRGRVRYVYRATRGFAIQLPRAAAQALTRDPRVAFVEEDGIVYPAAVQKSPPSWGLDRIDERDLPLDDRYRYSTSGHRIVNIHVVDSGIRVTHAEFGGRAFIGDDFVDDDGDGDPDDIGNDDPDPLHRDGPDCFGHGTAVAGVAAGRRAGVAKRARVWSYRVIGCDGTGTWSSVIAAIDAITLSGARPAVVNISLGGGRSSAANAAIRRSIASGLTYVIAAGNQNDDAANYSPSSVAQAVVVGGTSRDDRRQEESNWGPLVDLFAPGEYVASASPFDDLTLDVNTGTSLAAPHVSGVAALLLQTHPHASPAQVAMALVRAATRGRLTAVGPGSPNRLLYSRSRSAGGAQMLPLRP
jgi:subtilisin family serine protease